MKLGVMLYQLKAGPELVMKRIWFIANNVQPTARGRTFGTERCYDDVAAWLDRVRYLSHVTNSIL